MAEPVIIDDGGSTRIKLLKGQGVTGRMDNLLEVTNVAGTNQSKDFATGPFIKIKVLCVRKTGTAAPVAPGAFSIAIGLGDRFEIHSGQQRVCGKFVDRSAIPDNHPYHPAGTAADCEIIVKGVAGIAPIVEARHSEQQRRYIISNAPAIDKVKIKINGSWSTFPIPPDIIYTAVFLLRP